MEILWDAETMEDRCVEDMKVEETYMEVLDMDACKKDDQWDVASFDEAEPVVEMDSCVDAYVAKATLRIKKALEERDAKSLKAFDSVKVSSLVEEEMHIWTHGVLRDPDIVKVNDVCMAFGEAHQGEADLEVLSKDLVMVMLCCVAIDHALQKSFFD